MSMLESNSRDSIRSIIDACERERELLVSLEVRVRIIEHGLERLEHGLGLRTIDVTMIDRDRDLDLLDHDHLAVLDRRGILDGTHERDHRYSCERRHWRCYSQPNPSIHPSIHPSIDRTQPSID